MSKIIEALEFINDWVKKNMPDHPTVMNQGLGRQEIENKVEILPFYLAEEVYELYQWRNGGKKSFFPSPESWGLTTFFSLEQAISSALDLDDNNFPGMKVFPLFSLESGMYWTVGSEVKQDIAPIYSNDCPEFPDRPDFMSLTAMIENEVDRLRLENS
jgi:hypothetical protein